MGNACASSGDSENVIPDAADVKLEKSETLAAKPKFGLHTGKSAAEERSFQKYESAFEISQPSKIAAKVLSKLHIRGGCDYGKEKDEGVRQNGSTDTSIRNEGRNEPGSPRCSKVTTSYQCTVDPEDMGENPDKTNSSFVSKRACLNLNVHNIPNVCKESSSVIASTRECCECLGVPRPGKSITTKL
ncbi:hypothetical protein L1049_007121 [Liquidambar formosana]|uniref:Uncharacterized protein n=1 Tax=Liquidambar formosana TaxID=63359 RepID=A0AAP0RK29_LIQFO